MPRWLVWTISIVGFAIVGRWALNSAMALAGQPIMYPEWFHNARDYVEMAIAGLILWAITYYEGPNRASLTGTVAVNVRQGLQGAYALLVIGAAAYMGLLFLLTGMVASGLLPNNHIVFGVSNNPPDALHRILWSVHAAWTEEILLISLMFFLFRRTSLQINGVAFWLTGWATALVIVVRMSYHTYHGLMVIPMILTGWLIVRLYRTTGSVIPVMVVHLTWDLFGLAVAGGWIARVAFVAVLVMVAEFLTKGSNDAAAFGWRTFLNRTPPEHEFWARWRSEPDPEWLPAKPKSKRQQKREEREREHVGITTGD